MRYLIYEECLFDIIINNQMNLYTERYNTYVCLYIILTQKYIKEFMTKYKIQSINERNEEKSYLYLFLKEINTK